MVNISTNLSGIILSCNIGEIIITTDEEFIDVKLLFASSTILTERYYAYDGYVVLSNIAELFEQYLSKSYDSLYSDCSLFVSGAVQSISRVFRLYYCDKQLGIDDADDFFANNFLSLSRYVRIRPDDTYRLTWYDATGLDDGYKITASFIDENGEVQSYGEGRQFDRTPAGCKSILINSAELRDYMQHQFGNGIKLLSIMVSVGSRTVTLFIDPELTSSRQFFFLNCFNQVERVDINGITTKKFSSERSLAVVSRIRTQYDVSHSVEYETDSAPLTNDEALLVQQMLTSTSVKTQVEERPMSYNDFDDRPSILITDYTCEFANKPDELNSVKFTWQLSDSTVRLHTKPQRIFNKVFNPTYS